MVHRSLRILFGVAALAVVLPLASAQDEKKDKDAPPPPQPRIPIDEVRPGEEYRQYFKQPKTVPEFWSAISFEIEVGKFDLAAMLLRALLVSNPSDRDLVALEEKEGMIAFLKLRHIRPWVVVPPFDEKTFQQEIARLQKAFEDADKVVKVREDMEKARKARQDAINLNDQAYKDVEELIQRITTATKKHLSDPVRIGKFVKNLTATPEEQQYALKELYRSGSLVAPYLIKELKAARGDDRLPLLDALRRLNQDLVPPMLAALDSNDSQLQVDLINVMLQRNADEAVPYLWALTTSANPPEVRKKAIEALSRFLNEQPSRLMPAKVALAREAERYYLHQVKFADPKAVPVWRWDGESVTMTLLPATKAEEYFGMRFAGQSLAIDPTYQPAQIVLLSLVLDKTYEQAGLARPLFISAPNVHELLATTSPDLLIIVLERAMTERRTPVAIGAIRTLGALGETKANRPSASGAPVLVRALNYPDRRVHFAAAEALLNTPGTPTTGQSSRIVEVLRRSLAAEPATRGVPRVLVGYFDPELGARVVEAVRLSGYEAIKVSTGRELMRRLGEAADIDLILLEETLPDPGLDQLLANLRSDRNVAQLPVLLTAKRERVEPLRRHVSQWKNVTVIPAGFALDSRDLQVVLAQRTVDPGTAPLSELEIREYAERSARQLARLAQGEPAGYDVRGTVGVVADALRSGKLSVEGQFAAITVLSRVPGTKAQTELASVIMDGRFQPPVRNYAAAELVKHLQKHGALLNQETVGTLETLQGRPDTDPNLRGTLALVLGSLRPDPRTAGERLLRFRPEPAIPAPKEK